MFSLCLFQTTSNSRPLVHLAALHHYGHESWKPFLLALGTDVSARILAGRPGLEAAERSELNRRVVGWAWYLLREPMWSELKARFAFMNALASVPVLGFGVTLTQDMLHSLTRFWFFTSNT